jgi:hypothetical protein
VHVIGHHMPFHDLALLLTGDLVEDPAELLPDPSKQCPPPSFEYEHHLILAIPSGMRQALIRSNHLEFSLSVDPHQATEGRTLLPPRSSLSSLTGRTSGLRSTRSYIQIPRFMSAARADANEHYPYENRQQPLSRRASSSAGRSPRRRCS